jgi:hypothetical protein
MKKRSTIVQLQINPSVLDGEYGFDKSPIAQTTKISELENRDLSFQKDTKNTYQVKVSSVAFTKKAYTCFWDTCEFNHTPVYCPIHIKSTPEIKEYTSTINNKVYKIQDTINIADGTEIFVDGTFCSVECALAFIHANRHQHVYKDSEMLLYHIYQCNGVHPAAHWRLLEKYGGNMTLEMFRKSFSNLSYQLDGLFFLPLYYLYRENYHL